MKAAKLGILSVLTASMCCLGPALLALVGLGSLGVGAFLGRYHWWFIGAAITLLAFSWRNALREAHRCRTEACATTQGKTTRLVLTVASGVIAVVVGLNVYTYASQHQRTPAWVATSEHAALTAVVIPVKGMTCWSCELTVESSLKGLPGVHSVEANVNEQAAHVSYDPTQVGLEALMAAINRTGFRAEHPNEAAQP